MDVEFIPEDHFLGTADGISIRQNTNGYDTGWSTKFPDDEANVDTVFVNTMDGLYIPTVTPTDIEGG